MQVDLLVCDMNDHPTRVGELLLPVIDRLKPGQGGSNSCNWFTQPTQTGSKVHAGGHSVFVISVQSVDSSGCCSMDWEFICCVPVCRWLVDTDPQVLWQGP